MNELSAALPDELRAQVSGSSFYAGMRILPRAEREAMFAIYGFCRIVDDIADDETAPRPVRAAALDGWRGHIAALYAGGDAGGNAGMQMDIDDAIRWPAFSQLDLYCDRVASAVGRLSVRVFGMQQDEGIALSHHLGRALQLTNILRDIDEDAAIGRVYLPIEALRAAGIQPTTPQAMVGDPGLDAAARWLVPHAQRHFAQANAILRARPQGLLAAPRLMETAYSRVLTRMVAQGWAAPRRRVKVSKPALLVLALRLWLFP